MEDKETSKHWGQLSGIRLLPLSDARLRLKAAISSRGKDDLIIIGRSDPPLFMGLKKQRIELGATAIEALPSYL